MGETDEDRERKRERKREAGRDSVRERKRQRARECSRAHSVQHPFAPPSDFAFYRGASPIRNSAPLNSYSRTMPGALLKP